MADADERAVKRKRYTSRAIQLVVGDEQQTTIVVHEDNLRKFSPSFQAALNKDWSEATTGTISLPEDDEDVVSAYVDWLYRGVVDEAVYSPRGELEPHYSLLIRLYVFAEKIQNDEFANCVMDVLLGQLDQTWGEEECSYSPAESSIRLAYAGTPAGSPLRRLLAVTWAERGECDWFGPREGFPLEFMVNLAQYLMHIRGRVDKRWWVERREDWMKQK